MVNEASATSRWSPVGEKVAGSRDSVSGELQPDLALSAHVAILRQLLGLAAAAISITALYFGQDVLIPITLAVMLAFILSPVVSALQRIKLWRVPAVIITVLAALGIIGAVGTLIGTQAASLSVNATQYASAIQGKVEMLQGLAATRIEALSTTIAGDRKPPRPPASTPAKGTLTNAASAATANPPPRPVIVEVAPPRTSPFEIAKTILEPIIGPLETTFIVLIVAIFVLMQKEDLRDRFIRVFGSGDLHRTTMAIDDAGQRLSRYFLAQLGLNTTFGVIVTIGLWLLGVPSPALWGVLAGLCRFVPYIGAVLAAVGPLALGLAIDPNWSTAIAILIFFFVTEAVLGYVVEPFLYGHSTGLSPVSVIIAAIIWTWLWGPIGLIISTPVTLCFVVLGRHVKALEFFDVLLGDRPALTPVEGFYQRVLADNADEALAQAEAMLGDRNLATYYDEVVLEALKAAALDEARGTIDGARIRKMTQTMMAVIDELSGHVDDGDITPNVHAETIVACVAGRGPFDDAVTAMLSQVVSRRGLATRLIRHQATSRNEIARLKLAGITTIVLSYLELKGSPAHLRFLVRRLRHIAPDARIIVGLWPEGEAALGDSAIQSTLGADSYVSSLRSAAEAVVARTGGCIRAANELAT
jgi:predicted PurR-regulated permease PerM